MLAVVLSIYPMFTKGAVLFFVVSILLVYYYYDPSYYAFYPICPIYKLSGYQCGTCGTQRAVHALLHGDIKAAIGYNLFFVGVCLYAIIGFIFYKTKYYTHWVNSSVTKIGIFLFIVYSIARNI